MWGEAIAGQTQRNTPPGARKINQGSACPQRLGRVNAVQSVPLSLRELMRRLGCGGLCKLLLSHIYLDVCSRNKRQEKPDRLDNGEGCGVGASE